MTVRLRRGYSKVQNSWSVSVLPTRSLARIVLAPLMLFGCTLFGCTLFGCTLPDRLSENEVVCSPRRLASHLLCGPKQVGRRNRACESAGLHPEAPPGALLASLNLPPSKHMPTSRMQGVPRVVSGSPVHPLLRGLSEGAGQPFGSSKIQQPRSRWRAGTETLPPSARYSKMQRRSLRRAQQLGLGTTRAARQLLAGRVEPRWIQAAGGSRFPGTLQW
ncbi:MAG: hypothetical protein AAF550_08910, partial [Myxococcota bacterium]